MRLDGSLGLRRVRRLRGPPARVEQGDDPVGLGEYAVHGSSRGDLLGPQGVRAELVHLAAGRRAHDAAGAPAGQHDQRIVVLLAGDRVHRVDDRDVRGVDDGLAGEAVGAVQRHLAEQLVDVVPDQLGVQPQAPGVLERRAPQLALEQPVIAGEVLPHRTADDVVAAPAEGVDDLGEHVAHDCDVPDGGVAVTAQAEQPAQVGAADPDGQHALPVPVEQGADGLQVLPAGFAPGEVLVLQHRHREQP